MWWVRTKTGVWNGGFGPHQPFHVGILVPAGIPELAGAHDLRSDPGIVQSQECVVDPAAAARLAHELAPPASGEHPLVKSFTGMAERRLAAQALAGAEAIEGDGEELDACEGHRSCLLSVSWR